MFVFKERIDAIKKAKNSKRGLMIKGDCAPKSVSGEKKPY